MQGLCYFQYERNLFRNLAIAADNLNPHRKSAFQWPSAKFFGPPCRMCFSPSASNSFILFPFCFGMKLEKCHLNRKGNQNQSLTLGFKHMYQGWGTMPCKQQDELPLTYTLLPFTHSCQIVSSMSTKQNTNNHIPPPNMQTKQMLLTNNGVNWSEKHMPLN